MKKVLIVILILVILAGLGIGGYFVYKTYFAKEKEAQVEEPKPTELSLDAKKVATHLSNVANTSGTHWQRMWDISWELVESVEGQFDWNELDQMYKEIQQRDIYMVTTIKPFANWDQDNCHNSSYEADFAGPAKDKNSTLKVGKPCDMEKYKGFLKKVVERYDGDGTDDMPGLTIPVKYWEIMNEPSMQGGSTGGVGEELKFFVGTSADYFDILKASYETIKEADPEAKVLHAGMAGMQQNFQDFWDPVFSAGGGDYFDVANIHSINTDERREDMYVIRFKKYLEGFGIKDRPIFVTEAQFGDLAEKPTNISEFDQLIARSTIFTLAQGGDVIFFIENWLQWDRFKAMMEKNISGEEMDEEKEEGPEKMLEYSEEDLKSSTHKVYLNLVNFVNNYDKLEVIKEEISQGRNEDVDGSSASIAQYKITKGDSIVYVLWGNAALPTEITGTVEVTDIYGSSETKSASEITLNTSPVFVEIK